MKLHTKYARIRTKFTATTLGNEYRVVQNRLLSVLKVTSDQWQWIRSLWSTVIGQKSLEPVSN